MNELNEAVGESRTKIFCSFVMREGTIKKGVLINRMHISEQTFGREYLSYLDQYPMIKYNSKDRVFTYEP